MHTRERIDLHEKKCIISPDSVRLPNNGQSERFIVAMSLSEGELAALKNALSAFPNTHTKGQLLAYLRNGIAASGRKGLF